MGSPNLSPVGGLSNVTSPKAWTPVGTWVSNCSYEGTYWREGKFLCGQISIILTGAPTAAQLLITLPNSHTVDTSVTGTTFTSGHVIGQCYCYDFNGSSVVGNVIIQNTTQINPLAFNAAGTYTVVAGITNTVPFTFANNDVLTITFKVPCAQFS